jgi:hypothetical protein
MAKTSRRESFALSKLQFKCSDCPDVFEHANAQKHKLRHQVYECPLGCGAKAIGDLALSNHLINVECPNVPIYCNDCETEIVLHKKQKCVDK